MLQFPSLLVFLIANILPHDLVEKYDELAESWHWF